MTITYADESAIEVTASMVDCVAFEDARGKAISRLFDDWRLGDVAWLAWHTAKRTGATTAEHDAWLETVESIQIGSVGVDPLEEPTPSTGT